jgi:exosortase
MSLPQQQEWSVPAVPAVNLMRRHAFFVVFALAVLALGFDALRALVVYAWDMENKNASQIFLIPFISAGFLFLNRKDIFSRVGYGLVPGALTMLAGAVLLATAGAWGFQQEGDRLAVTTGSVVVMLLGGFLLFYGPAAFRAALFPLLFLVFMLPIPSFILDPSIRFLQWGSAEMSYLLLKLSGTPIFREGFVFAMPGITIEVAPECSGIRSCIGMFILSIIGGHMLLQTQWKRIVLVCVAIPIMIFKNAVRIATLSLGSVYVDPAIIESRLHREGGIPFFLLALVLIYPVVRMLIKSEKKTGEI